MADATLRPRFGLRRLLLLLLVLVVFALLGVLSRPPHRLVIETGPEGGSYHQVALQYRAFLARRGIDVVIQPQPNSMEIVRHVADPKSSVQVGFVAQDVRDMANEPVFAVGQIQLQPLFIFASAELGRRSVLDNLRGRRIVMPPEDSATSDAAVKVLALYDITAENTSFTFMPLAEAAKALQTGRFDAGIFMLAPENPTIRALAADSSLRLMPYTEGRAVANHLPFLRPVVMPRGIYNIADVIPPHDTPLVAATVGVVIQENIHPYLVYSLLEAMSALHRAPTFLSGAGEFPTLAGAQLAAHPQALTYFKSGVPWAYRELPPWLASVIDRYQILGLLLLGIGAIALLLGPISDLGSGLVEAMALGSVRRIDQVTLPARAPTPTQRARLGRAERVLRWIDPDHPALPTIADIRRRGEPDPLASS